MSKPETVPEISISEDLLELKAFAAYPKFHMLGTPKWMDSNRDERRVWKEGYHQALKDLENKEPIPQQWECNSCGFSDYTDAVSQDELDNWLQCSNCGQDEFHLVPVL